MAELQGKKIANSFRPLGRDLCARMATPFGQVTFWVYLLIGIILCGGVPIWVELLRHFAIGATQNTESIRTAINAYYPAIGCAAAVQLAFASGEKKYLNSFSFFAAFFFFVFSGLTLFLEKTPVTPSSWVIGIAGCVLAIAMWWIANGLDPTYQDTVDPDAPLGGSPQSPLVGDTTGFTV